MIKKTPDKLKEHWYTHNLAYGFQAACLLPSDKKIIPSWHALIAVPITMALLQIFIESSHDGAGGELQWGWYRYPLIVFSLTLMASYLICLLFKELNKTLDIAIAFYNAYFYIFIGFVTLFIYSPAWYDAELYTLILHLTTIWAFLIMLRVVSDHLNAHISKLILASLIASGLMYTLHNEIYFDRIYARYEEEQEENDILQAITSEDLFNKQADLRQKYLDTLTPSEPGQVDIFAITFASFANQDVFSKEVKYINSRLGEKLKIQNILTMTNHKNTVENIPLANTTNLKAYLNELVKNYIQPEEDIILIYLTSHGDAEQGLSVNLDYRFSMNDLSPANLSEMLIDSEARNLVLMISACYSGTFLPELINANSMIMTASAADRTSFGCSNTSEMTYFASAYFKDALAETTDLEEAFYKAKKIIEARESSENLTPPSDPQIFIGENIRKALMNYKAAAIIHEK